MADITLVEKAGAANDFATVRIPLDKRRSTFSVSAVIVGLIIAMSALYTGAALVGSLTLSQTIAAVLTGNIILTAYGGLLGIIGAREGLPVGILVRHSFGRWGSNIISGIIAVSLLGWFAWQCGFFGQTINAMFPGGGIITQPVAAGIWGGILMMTTAYIGYKGLAALSSFAAPLIFLLAIVGIIIVAVKTAGFVEMPVMITEGSTITFSSAIVMIVGAFAIGGVIQPDCTRYCKNGITSFVATVIGFVIAHSVVILAGFIICAGTGITDLPKAMLSIMMVPSLLMLIFAQWTTNDNNLYSSSLGITNIFPKLKKKQVTLAGGIVATILGAFGVANLFTSWLVILGTAVPPVAGILIADYFLFHKAKYEFGEGTRYGYISIPAIVAWIAGIIIGFTVHWGIACINSLVISMVVYVILMNLYKTNPDKKYLGGFCIENEYGETKRV
jgi:cytosine permease